MKKLTFLMLIVALALIGVQCKTDKVSENKNTLARNFVSPPDSARIWVYWFWLNSNLTREGITADLEAMKRVGIGGVLIMEVDQGAPVGKVAFMSDEWRALFKHMISEANRLGIEVNMNDDAGWNGSGGPWVPLEQSMQSVVSAEIKVPAGRKFSGTIPQPEAKEGFYKDIAVLAFPYSKDSTLRQEDIINLSDKMTPDGKILWYVPALNTPEATHWSVVRFGVTFTGAKNHPAPASGTGPECDKLSTEAIETHYNGMIGKLVADNKEFVGKTFTATHVDSWEVGGQNWTPKMREEFLRLRGYDMIHYLPVLVGRIVDSKEISERFQRDVRQTVSDLLAVNYIGHLRTLANRDGLRLTMECYTTPANDLDVGNYIDEPISEFWWPNYGFAWSSKAMSSLSHVNGLPITGAEAFTAGSSERWLAHPATIKTLGDRAFSEGVNRFIVHRYAMQPWVDDRIPGMTMGPWGQHYERTQTWWEDSKAWHEYVARCQYLLRQGTFVADILSLQSEEPQNRFKPLTLSGYDYDGISPQAFLSKVTVENGELVLPSGMRYKLLLLPDDKEVSLAILGKITDLVEAGATVLGNPPVKCAGLSGYPESDEQVKTMATKLWGAGNEKDRTVGQGRVLTGMTPEEALALMNIKPDFLSSKPVNRIHHSVGGLEVYFVANPETADADITCHFRVSGMKPEAWDAETGEMRPVTVFEEKDGTTRIPLHFKPAGSLFIVFSPGQVKESKQIISIKSGAKELAPMDFTVTKEAPKRAPKVKPVETVSSFTMAGWIRPENDFAVTKEASEGTNALIIERNDVVYPAPGHEVWTDQDAGAGFGAGNNGICVYEHGNSYFPSRLVHLVPITGWTHVAVVYQDNTPSLWINGKLVRQGTKSPKTIHGSIGVEHKRQVIPFDGESRDLMQFPGALTGEEILKLAQAVPDTLKPLKVVPVRLLDLMRQEWLANGQYELTTADGKSLTVSITGIPDPLKIEGPWEVTFTSGWGAPEKATFDRLISWSRHPEEGIRYYSGSATYHKTFTFSPGAVNKSEEESVIYLDLGRVAVMAEVHLNGKNLGILWNPPYRVEVTGCIRSGENELEIRVVNLLVNRMIGDEQLQEDSERNEDGTLKKWPQWLLDGKPSPAGRYTFTSWRLWPKDSPLQTSGLLGPVTIQTAVRF